MGTSNYRVAVVVYPGFDELDAIGPYEVLQMAGEVRTRDIEVKLVTLDGTPEITASHDTVLRPAGSLEGEWDLVIVPGGGWAKRRGAFIQVEREELPKALAALHAAGTTIAAVCTGAMLLAAAGLTEGRPAITHHAAIEDLRKTGAEIVRARVVDDGDIVTSGGITSGIDLALWLIARIWDDDLAHLIATRLEYTQVDDVHLGPRHRRQIGSKVLA
jgi:transcriptional regulator GlxA family with amidase domain